MSEKAVGHYCLLECKAKKDDPISSLTKDIEEFCEEAGLKLVGVEHAVVAEGSAWPDI